MKSQSCRMIEAMLESESDKIRLMALNFLSPERTMESMLRAWLIATNAQVRSEPTVLPIENVERRLRLTFERLIETAKASGLQIISKTTGQDLSKDLKLVPVEGGVQDLVEIADGLGNILVVTLGHAVEHGFPITKIFHEIMLSNGTELPLNGQTIVNRCIQVDVDKSHDCGANPNDCVLLDCEAPIGNLLKPSTYVKADISGVLEGRIEEDSDQHKFAFAQ